MEVTAWMVIAISLSGEVQCQVVNAQTLMTYFKRITSFCVDPAWSSDNNNWSWGTLERTVADPPTLTPASERPLLVWAGFDLTS